MINITLTVNKANVYNEVAKTTSYEGKKMEEDKRAYERIFTIEEDRAMLERFWNEACNMATETFKRFIVSVTEQNDSTTMDISKDYVAQLEVSNSYDTNLTNSIQASLFSFFVNAIISKWNKFTHQQTVKSYEDDANASLNDIQSKLFYRKKPTRVRI